MRLFNIKMHVAKKLPLELYGSLWNKNLLQPIQHPGSFHSRLYLPRQACQDLRQRHWSRGMGLAFLSPEQRRLLKPLFVWRIVTLMQRVLILSGRPACCMAQMELMLKLIAGHNIMYLWNWWNWFLFCGILKVIFYSMDFWHPCINKECEINK